LFFSTGGNLSFSKGFGLFCVVTMSNKFGRTRASEKKVYQILSKNTFRQKNESVLFIKTHPHPLLNPSFYLGARAGHSGLRFATVFF
jgi:hypothetical protein